MFGGGAKNGVGVIVAVRVAVAVRVGPGVRVGGAAAVRVAVCVVSMVAVGVGVGVCVDVAIPSQISNENGGDDALSAIAGAKTKCVAEVGTMEVHIVNETLLSVAPPLLLTAVIRTVTPGGDTFRIYMVLVMFLIATFPSKVRVTEYCGNVFVGVAYEASSVVSIRWNI